MSTHDVFFSSFVHFPFVRCHSCIALSAFWRSSDSSAPQHRPTNILPSPVSTPSALTQCTSSKRTLKVGNLSLLHLHKVEKESDGPYASIFATRPTNIEADICKARSSKSKTLLWCPRFSPGSAAPTKKKHPGLWSK